MKTNNLGYTAFGDTLIVEDQQLVEALGLRRKIVHKIDPDIALRDVDITVIDFETTGLDVDNDRIIEIGAVRTRGGRFIDSTSTLVGTNVDLDPIITSITGITKADLEGKPDAGQALTQLLDSVRGSLLVAHNAEFDYSILAAELLRLNIDFDWPILCTWLMSKEFLGHLPSRKLSEIANFYSLPQGVAHRAEADAKLTAKVLFSMLKNEAKSIQTIGDAAPFMVKLGTKA